MIGREILYFHMVRLSVLPYFLNFHRPFTLAHGTRVGTQLAFVKLEAEGIIAYGEASLPPYLPETVASVRQWVEGQYDRVVEVLKADPFEDRSQMPFSYEATAASCALQSAILYWYAAAKGIKLSERFPTEANRPGVSLTLSKSDLDVLDEKLKLTKHFTHLKLKFTGADDDLEFARAIRKRTGLPFCIDANQGFRDRESAIKTITALGNLHCVLVEQPLSDHDHEGHQWIKERVAVPIIADESIRHFNDLEQYHSAYSGVNIKLMKCGGLFQAERMLDFLDHKIENDSYVRLLGCMSESSLGVATSALLASRFSIADLDAPYLSKNDPFEGFRISDGEIQRDELIRLKEGSTFLR